MLTEDHPTWSEDQKKLNWFVFAIGLFFMVAAAYSMYHKPNTQPAPLTERVHK